MRRITTLFATSVLCLSLLASCGQEVDNTSKIDLEYERYQLDNGLTVLLHRDTSDPIVSVQLSAHVGSAREKVGRTGFAHLFEHLLFLESENLGKGGLDKMSARIGGSGANGYTNNDQTVYLQTVPNDALEKMIWAEADKLGYFINTVTEDVLAKEKQVVLNEKRSSNDNRQYGFGNQIMVENIYPTGHPYSWPVIGSMQDLNAATLKDVKDFFNTWYVPNNVTLTIVGDFDIEQTKTWIEKYFAEIKRGTNIEPLEIQAANITETKNLVHEDSFAKVAKLDFAWPTVEMFHPDSYALNALFSQLTSGKKAPFNRVLIDERKVTSSVAGYNREGEIAGMAQMAIRTYRDIDLDAVNAAVEEAFTLFEAEGVNEDELRRYKVGNEVAFYGGLGSVGTKGTLLTSYSMYADDPSFAAEDLKRTLAVSSEDIMRVYNRYIKDQPHIMLSFVPKGQPDLAVEGAISAGIVEEEIILGNEAAVDPTKAAVYERTASSFDRTIEPPYGETPLVKTPAIWEEKLDNGLRVLGIIDSETPMVSFSLVMKGGAQLDDLTNLGAAAMMGRTWDKGTLSKTTAELENAFKDIGAGLSVSVSSTSTRFSATARATDFEKTLALMEEVLLSPRYDVTELENAKAQTVKSLKASEVRPTTIAAKYTAKLLYGKKHLFSNSMIGTAEHVETLTVDDLKVFHAEQVSPTVAAFHIVGDVDRDRVMNALKGLSERWEPTEVTIPTFQLPKSPVPAALYFFDRPGATQSNITATYLAIPQEHPDSYKVNVMNYILGGGGFASRLTQDLREGKGYTYGVRSGFSSNGLTGAFTLSTAVRANVTLESIERIKFHLDTYGDTFTDVDHSTTQNSLIKSQARAFESHGSKRGLLEAVTFYSLPYDYITQRQELVRNLTREDVQALAKQYLPADRMIYIVVGDAETQFERLKDLDLGEIILVEPEQKQQ